MIAALRGAIRAVVLPPGRGLPRVLPVQGPLHPLPEVDWTGKSLIILCTNLVTYLIDILAGSC